MYQTDWSLAALTLRVANPEAAALQAQPDQPFNLPVASLEGKPGVAGKLWATFLPVEEPVEGQAPKGISLVARDLQSVVVYDSRGQFVGVRRPGSNKPIEVEGLQVRA
jgi:cytochrome c biogenesis protein